MEKKNGLDPPFYGVGTEDVKKTGGDISEIIESAGQLEGTFASNMNALLEGISSRASRIQDVALPQSDSQIRSRIPAVCLCYAMPSARTVPWFCSERSPVRRHMSSGTRLRIPSFLPSFQN